MKTKGLIGFRLNHYALRLSLVLAVVLVNLSSNAQEQPAPSIIWTNTTLTPVIAIDSQTNIYCSSNGSVVTIAPDGAILGTNNMCPAGGICQRDASGNFFFAGILSPPVNFGVTSLTNLSNGNCFIAKYTSDGVCLWAEAFGPTGTLGFSTGLTFGDLQLDPQGNAYTSSGITYNEAQNYQTTLYKFNSSGSNAWSAVMPGEMPDEIEVADSRIGGLSSTNGYVFNLAVLYNDDYAVFSEFNSSTGSMTAYTSTGYGLLYEYPSVPTGLHPAVDSSGDVYDFERGSSFPGSVLVKRNSSGGVIWDILVSGSAPFTTAPDIWGGVYLADFSPSLSHYDLAGNLIWKMTLPALVNSVVSDSQGNRAVSLTNGQIYWLSQEVLTAPTITNQPAGQTIMVGSNATFTITAGGSTPLYYFWQQNSNALPSATNAALSLTNVTTNQAGYYSVIISNLVGTTNSAPALLRVKNVELFYGSQLLTNGSYYFSNTPAFTIVNEFTNGSSFYTLDGSTPSFLSTAYTGPFTISNNVTIQAIGYSADFSQSEFADPVLAFPPVLYSLTASTVGGGTVGLNPPGGVYATTNTVTVTATPAAGFTFLYWTGAASGYDPVINVTLTTNETIQAVFGTTLSNTVAGNGQVFIYPIGPLYPYGSTVRLQALPQTGYCFGVWGNSASGNTNPLFYTITNANPVISAAFAGDPRRRRRAHCAHQRRRTSQRQSFGEFFPAQSVRHAHGGAQCGKDIPRLERWRFSGTNNPLNISLSQSEVITANFTGTAALLVNRAFGDGLSAQGFRLTLASDMQNVFQIQSSSNLINWSNIALVTNVSGQVLFTDPGATNLPANFYQLAPAP